MSSFTESSKNSNNSTKSERITLPNRLLLDVFRAIHLKREYKNVEEWNQQVQLLCVSHTARAFAGRLFARRRALLLRALSRICVIRSPEERGRKRDPRLQTSSDILFQLMQAQVMRGN